MGLKTVKFQIHKRPGGLWLSVANECRRPKTNIHFIENQFCRASVLDVFYKLLITFPILNELLSLSPVGRTRRA